MRYEELLPAQLADAVENRYPAVLPVSQLEPQGELLPLGADKLILEAVLDEAAKAVPFVSFPTLHVTACADFRFWPGLVRFRAETTLRVVEELIENLFGLGFQSLLLVTYYGGHNHNLLDLAASGVRLRPEQSIALLRLPTLIEEEARPLREAGIDLQYPLLAHLCPDLVREETLAAAERLPSERDAFLASRRRRVEYRGSLDLGKVMPQGPYSGFPGARAKDGDRLFRWLVKGFAAFVREAGSPR